MSASAPMSTSQAHENNMKLFRIYKRKLSHHEPFAEYAVKFANWLNDTRAYYPEARPHIVRLVETARATVDEGTRAAKNRSPDVLNDPDAPTENLVPHYVKLVGALLKYQHLFAEKDLQERIEQLRASINVTPVTPQTIPVPLPAVPSAHPSQYSAPQHLPIVPISTQRTDIMAPESSSLATAMIPVENLPSETSAAPKAVTASIGSSTDAMPQTLPTTSDSMPSSSTQPSGPSVSQAPVGPRKAKLKKKKRPTTDIDFNTIVAVDLMDNSGWKKSASTGNNLQDALVPLDVTMSDATPMPQETSLLRDETVQHTVPVPAQTTQIPLQATEDSSAQPSLPLSSASVLPITDVPMVLDVPPNHEAETAIPVSSENTSKQPPLGDPMLLSSDAELPVETAEPALEQEAAVEITGSPMTHAGKATSDQMDTGQPDHTATIVQSPLESKEGDTHSLGTTAVPQQPAETPDPQATQRQTSQGPDAELQDGSSSLPRASHTRPGSPPSEAPADAIVPDLPNEPSESFAQVKTVSAALTTSTDQHPNDISPATVVDIVTTEQQDSDIMQIDDASPVQSNTNLETNLLPNPDFDDDEHISKPPFADDSLVMVVQKGGKCGAINIEFALDDKQSAQTTKWNSASRSGTDATPSLCFSLGCYSNADILSVINQSEKKPILSVLNACRPTWPTTGGIWLSGTFKGKQAFLPLAPPLAVTPDSLVDVTSFLVPGLNRIQIDQQRDMSKFMFALISHQPTAGQLARLARRRKSEGEWKAQLLHLVRPFDIGHELL